MVCLADNKLPPPHSGNHSAPELVSSDDKPAATSDVEPDEKDIKLVMEQASVEREKAVKAIKEADGDLINASESRSSVFSLAGTSFRSGSRQTVH